MLIQHVFTEEIVSKVYGEDDFHQHNNVAKELYAREETFFTGDLKKRSLRGLGSYYAAIRAAAAQIGNHHAKQAFLKVIYENFYKVYNVKAADRLGVVYKLGNRSDLEWILDQHKEKKPKDPTIREKFDIYRFADYKEKVIDLLTRVIRESVQTQAIVEAMRKVGRWPLLLTRLRAGSFAYALHPRYFNSG